LAVIDGPVTLEQEFLRSGNARIRPSQFADAGPPGT
jgi:hypothetical protein